MSVAIMGTVAFDSVKTPKGEHNYILGGTASFASTAATIFSEDAAIVSIVGEDFPQEHLDYFKSRNVNIDGLKITPGKTFHWKGYYEGDMNQAFTIQTDLNTLLDFDPVVPDSIKDYEYVFCGNTDPVHQKKFIEQFSNPKLVVLDTMNFWIEHSLEALKEVLKLVDVLIINDQEARLLTGINNLIETLPKILEMGPKRLVVKKGEHGSIMYNGSNYFLLPAIPLMNLVDPTGAGDSFAGGFIGYLSGAKDLTEETFKQAVIAGTLVSSFTVQDFSLGAIKKLTRNDLNSKYGEFKSSVNIPQSL